MSMYPDAVSTMSFHQYLHPQSLPSSTNTVWDSITRWTTKLPTLWDWSEEPYLTSCLANNLWMSRPAGPLPAPITVTSGFSIRADRKCSMSFSPPTCWDFFFCTVSTSRNLKLRDWAREITISASCTCLISSCPGGQLVSGIFTNSKQLDSVQLIVD